MVLSTKRLLSGASGLVRWRARSFESQRCQNVVTTQGGTLEMRLQAMAGLLMVRWKVQLLTGDQRCWGPLQGGELTNEFLGIISGSSDRLSRAAWKSFGDWQLMASDEADKRSE